MQGIDDGSDWWLHPLLPHAYRPIYRQVEMVLMKMAVMVMVVMVVTMIVVTSSPPSCLLSYPSTGGDGLGDDGGPPLVVMVMVVMVVMVVTMIVTSSPHLCLSSYPLKGRDGRGDNSKS